MQEEKSWSDAFVIEHADAIRQRLAIIVGTTRGSQARVSRETGIRANHLSQLLSGKNALHLRHVVMISKSLSVNLQWLMTGKGHPDDVDTSFSVGAGAVGRGLKALRGMAEKAPPGVSTGHGDSGDLSTDQVGKLLAAVERERLTPDERAVLAKYQSLPPTQRARFWALLEAGAADPVDAPATMVNESERGKGKGGT